MCEVLVETMSFSVLRGGERLPLVVDSGWVQLGHAPHVRALRWSEVTGIWRPDPMSARLDHPSGVPLQFTFETPEERDRFHLAARAARPDLVPQQGHGSAGTSGWMGIQEFVLCGLVLVLLGTIASWLSLGNLVSANLLAGSLDVNGGALLGLFLGVMATVAGVLSLMVGVVAKGVQVGMRSTS